MLPEYRKYLVPPGQIWYDDICLRDERNEHHFLFHIFRLDREENPMPRHKAESLLQYLMQLFTTGPKKERGNDE